MAPLPQQTPSPVSGDDRNLIVVDENYFAPSFEDRVRIFWERHGNTVISAIVLIVIFFAARSLFGIYADHRENQIRAAYAEAGDDIAALRSFAAANPAAPLAGVALARVGDDAYQAGDYAAAAAAYAQAAPLLATDPVGARVRMGQAISLLKAEDPGAKALLENMANDTTFAPPLRAEAAYHLGVIAQQAGQTQEASNFFSLAVSVDTSGLWAQRASRMMERLPAPAAQQAGTAEAPPAAEEAATVSFPSSTK